MRFYHRNRNKYEPVFTRRNIAVLAIIACAFFYVLMFKETCMPKAHDANRNYFLNKLAPYPTAIPDPVIAENEKIKAEIDAMREENGKMTEYILTSRGGDRKPKEVINYAKLSAPRYIVELIERMCVLHGFDSGAEIYSICAYESQFNPACHNTKGEDSRGLLQVNVKDPSHAKRNPNKTKLFDPAYNLDYQLDELKLYYRLGKQRGLKGADLAIFISKFGQRPKWTEDIAQAIRQYYKEYKNAVVKEVKS
jgi:hypothetical protein